MKKLAFLICMMTTPAFAQDTANPFTSATGDSGSGVVTGSDTASDLPRPDAKPEILLRMSKKDYQRLLRRTDVPGADYVPGVDVRGNSVVGADLQGTLTAADVLPNEIAFELALNPLSYAGNVDLENVFSETSAGFGTIKYNLSSGTLTLNGKPLADETEQDMVALCR